MVSIPAEGRLITCSLPRARVLIVVKYKEVGAVFLDINISKFPVAYTKINYCVFLSVQTLMNCTFT